uniref:12-oxophytodienoate reductase n=1 Tax=Sphingobacterium sp. (strain 21) TaxID=743722 RepID=F4C6D8_SPHS2
MKLLTDLITQNFSLKNRVVMAPMTRSRADNDDLAPNELMAKYYEQRASAGLIITEGTPVSKMANGYINVPGIYSEKQIVGWKHVTQAVHNKGGKIFAQLWHVGRISHPDLLDGKLPLGPSAINPNVKAYTKDGFVDTVTPKEMSIKEIQDTVSDFKQAAVNAIKAGFDGVEIHAANGYLFHQFFSKVANQRNDEYGGTVENRARLLFAVIEAIAEELDLSKVGVRISPTLNGTFGITIDDETEKIHEYIASRLNAYNLAYLHISGFTMTEWDDPLKMAIDTAKRYRPIYKGVLMINKGFTKDAAEQVLQEGIADLVSFGVPFIANPDLVERFEHNIELNEADKGTFYTPGAEGYIDYPTALPTT